MDSKEVRGLMEAYSSIYKNISEDHVAIAMGKMLDSEGGMIKNQLETIERSVELLRSQIKSDDMQVPAWVQAKVTLATENILTCANYMAGKSEESGMKEENLFYEEKEKENEKDDKNKTKGKKSKNGGATKKSETKFHLKLDNLVHGTFGPSPEEKKMKEEVETDLFDYLLEYLVAEGYADTNKAAIAIMANMSEEWKQDIAEAKYGTKAGRKRLAKKIRKGEEIGKSGPGTGFKAVEKAAKEGGAENPAAVAAAQMWKTHGGKKG